MFRFIVLGANLSHRKARTIGATVEERPFMAALRLRENGAL
jgi:hypothetical protein